MGLIDDLMKNLMLLAAVLLSFTTLTAKEYKVANPDEFQKAAAAALAGDEIVIANGNYQNWALTFKTNGTSDKPILIRAETPGEVVFSGTVNKPVFQLNGTFTVISGITFSGCQVFKGKDANGLLIELKDAKSCRVTACVFNKNTAETQFTPLVVVSGHAEQNRVDHCSFSGNENNQELQVKITAAAVPVYTLIDHNTFKDKPKVNWKVFNGGECIQIGQDPVLLGNQSAYTTVRDNQFVACNGEAEVISNKSSGNKYINNSFSDCKGELVMRGGHECVIDSNTFKGGTGGIRINGTHHILSNNTFEGLPIGIRLMYGMAKGKDEVGFYIAAGECLIQHNRIDNCEVGILVGDSKNADWTGKFDTTRYPSRTIQDVAPFNNRLVDNVITNTRSPIVQIEK